MSNQKISLSCYNQYCVFNKDNKCVRKEVSLNRVGVCEDMFLINAKHIENLQGIKFNYMKNLFEPTDEIMKNDINWFNKHMDIKEVHPLQEIFNEIKKLTDKKKN